MSIFIRENGDKQFYLMLCELHYPPIHGKTEESDVNIETHFLVYDRFEPKSGISYSCLDEYEEYNTDTEYDSEEEEDGNRIIKINDALQFLQEYYSNPVNFDPHPTIRNYHNIISRINYIKPEIGEYIVLPTLEYVAILKTFWIRIIQRKWKKVFKERKHIIQSRSHSSSLYFRELTGKWQQHCYDLPGIKGMLKALNKR
jgi:hypothetical protein